MSLQKQQINNRKGNILLQVYSLVSIFILSLVFSSFNVIRKNTVKFFSGDGLEVTADEYIILEDNPYILLFHEQESSRGEYQTIARRLCKMDYNCLAVDIRNGGNMNFVSNETIKNCREIKCSTGVSDIELDIIAAIEYAFNKTEQPVVLFGSGSNGSLCLKIAKENENVRAVVALSPGEYFLPLISIQDTIANLKKPLFVSSSKSEFAYVSELVKGVEKEYLTLFEPVLGEGGRGTFMLHDENENNSEYWLALLLFFKELV